MYRVSAHYLSLALERNARLLAMAQAHEMETLLKSARGDLLFLAQNPVTAQGLTRFLLSKNSLTDGLYRELAWETDNPKSRFALVQPGGKPVEITPGQAAVLPAGPFTARFPGENSPPGHVSISPLLTVTYPSIGADGSPQTFRFPVFRLSTGVFSAAGERQGTLMLSVDARGLRNILSIYNSTQSPLYAFPRTSEKRYSFFFDPLGWILFQSENTGDWEREPGTDTARSGLRGDLGKPGQEAAFRPSPEHDTYWTMVADVQGGKHGSLDIGADLASSGSFSRPYFLSYAPVRFPENPSRPPQIIGGVAYVDTSLLTTTSSSRQLDVMFTMTIFTILVISGLIMFLSRAIVRPVLRLTSVVRSMHNEGALHEITLPPMDRETTMLQEAINTMISSIHTQGREILLKDEHIRAVSQRQPAELDTEALVQANDMGIAGSSSTMARLRGLIRKAAATDADVLIIGETGTGKELTAEAIHKESARSGGPFISINCGALDENLLLDALFGHVKGAFSEAKTDRKGAFNAADGGTLLLDEIGNASVKVQQALLRALSVRRIRPLGSDGEIPFDARVMAATNVDLTESVKAGTFREDLYYRLKVITIPTPPLRDHKEDIPLMAAHFLQEAGKFMKKENFRFSRGALERLLSHDWPGNARELKNCITRAMALAEGDILYMEDLRLDDQAFPPPRGETARPEVLAIAPQARDSILSVPGSDPFAPEVEEDRLFFPDEKAPRLNPRQKKAWAFIQTRASINRAEYQKIVGGDMPDRTAQYDLQDLVKKGLLKKVGKGPATQYFPANPKKA
jgi:DNA-binding NtrC family response regulator